MTSEFDRISIPEKKLVLDRFGSSKEDEILEEALVVPDLAQAFDCPSGPPAWDDVEALTGEAELLIGDSPLQVQLAGSRL